MADSDDEHDRRRARDKFRRERSDYQERRDERNRREEWTERSGRRERDYDPQRRRDRYSPLHHDVSPPIKRMRRDWDGHRRLPGCDLSYPFGGGNMMGGPPHGGWAGGMPQDMGMIHNQHGFGSHQGSQRDIDMPITQPPMMTFKQFLGSQDDSIDDQEAVRKYNEYKLEFRRQQINEFFLNHKEEEWFKAKYHPEEFGKRLAEQRASFKKRLDAFMELFEKNSIDGISVDSDKSDSIIHLLDAAVIKFEGGSDFDLKCLDEPYEEEVKPKEPDTSQSVKNEEKPVEKKEKDQASQEEKEKKSPESRRKHTRNYSSDEDDDSSADSESELESTVSTNNAQEVSCATSVVLDSESKEEKGKQMPDKEKPHSDDILEKKLNNEKSEENEVKIDDEKKNESEVENKENLESVCPKEDACKDQKPRPRPLHKTKSIFLRNLAPTIAKQEIEAMCKRYDGLLRVAISDPQPERRFLRRGWVTFDRTVNIKEICWNLNNIRLRDCELGAIVNRDLSRRVRSVNGITAHKQVVLSDIKLATRMIQNLDEKRNLWDDPGTKQKEQNFGIVSRNPLLKNITDYLIEEASAEEEELLGMSEETKQNEDTASTLERDETLIKVLDRLILYLRIVHSLDYYNHCEYINEDEMPNRCGIIHARGLPPSVKVTQREINDYIRNFEQKAVVFLQPRVKLGEDEALILGKKDPIVEVEKFVQANIQELSKDKWLCPLSGKKFKGAEFVRKHIFNKHAIKVEEVRKEVKYFNNYLIDPKRPQLSPHPSNCSFGSGPSSSRDEMYPVLPSHHVTNGSYPLTPMPYGGSHRGFQNKDGYGAPFGGRNSSSGGFSKRSNYGRRSNPHPREVIGYHDLDRPQDLEMF